MSNDSVRTERLPGPFGIAVEGIDVAQASDAEFDVLAGLLYQNHLLVLRNQTLSPEDYITFGKRWGELVPYFQTRWTLPGYPEILMITNEAIPGRALPPAENWHADGTYLDQPHSVTMLFGQEAPAEGGETWFAGTALAYDALSEDDRAAYEKLIVKHVKNGGERLALEEEQEKALTLSSQTTDEERSGLHPVKHPLVLKHPVNGRPALYCSTTTAYGIEGMDEDAAIELLLKVKRHVLKPEFRQSHKTMPGEIMLWDNYAVLHKAAPTKLSNADGERRILHRITVNGLPARFAKAA